MNATPHREQELLLCCARTCIGAERAEHIRSLLHPNLNWAYLIEIAALNGVLPLLYRNLNAISPEAVPGPVMAQLRDHFHDTSLHNLRLTGQLLRLLDLFGAHAIPALPFKGPALAASIYGDLSLRQFDDLDILVPESHILRARNLLVAHGYQAQPGGYQLTLSSSQERTHLRSGCDYVFISADSQSKVELHWRFAPRYIAFPLELERLWERLEPQSLSGRTIAGFAPEDLLQILCMHGSKHLWERLSWLCDVAELIRARPQIDWDRVREQARTLGSTRRLLLGLRLAMDLLGTALPAQIVQEIRGDAVVQALAVDVRQKLFDTTHDIFAEWPFEQIFHLRSMERGQDRIRYCFDWALMPTTAEWDYLRLPARLSFLYYLVRPIRVVKKCGQGLGKEYLQRRSKASSYA